MGNRPFMFPFRTFSVLLKVMSAYPGPVKVRRAFLEEIFMRRSWRKLFEKQAYRVVTPIENPYSQCIFVRASPSLRESLLTFGESLVFAQTF